MSNEPTTGGDRAAELEQQLAEMRAAIVCAGAALSVGYPKARQDVDPIDRADDDTVDVVPAVTVSTDFLHTIATTIDAIRAVDIDGQLRRVYEVVLPEYRAVTADMSDGVYEVFTKASRFEELHTELTHLARAARVALALGEGDLVYPDWMPREAVAADDAEVLKRARGTVAMFDDMARMMAPVEG